MAYQKRYQVRPPSSSPECTGVPRSQEAGFLKIARSQNEERARKTVGCTFLDFKKTQERPSVARSYLSHCRKNFDSASSHCRKNFDSASFSSSLLPAMRKETGLSCGSFYARARWWPMLGYIRTERTSRNSLLSLFTPPPPRTRTHVSKALAESLNKLHM